jgi:demethylmenaquinone methyltransferase/2-methoxy-6-polyprenyl-1,4-benzoquinol methylase
VKLPRPHRYGPGARFYDVLSLELLLYRSGRLTAIEQLRLRPRDRVLDVGCGTGLNFRLLAEAVGPSGQVVGVDASDAMLEQARRRVPACGWSNVATVAGDASRLCALTDGPFDAVLFTYSLAVIEDWVPAWQQALTLLRPGGRIAVADTALPVGRWRALSPLARLALLTGGVRASRQVWQRVVSDTTGPVHLVLKGGHVHVAAGSKRGPAGAGPV